MSMVRSYSSARFSSGGIRVIENITETRYFPRPRGMVGVELYIRIWWRISFSMSQCMAAWVRSWVVWGSGGDGVWVSEEGGEG